MVAALASLFLTTKTCWAINRWDGSPINYVFRAGERRRT